MVDSVGIVSFFELGVGVVVIGIAILAWRYRDRPAGVPLVLLALSAAGWAVAAGIASLLVDPWTTRVAQFIGYLLTGIAAITWFYVVVEYTDARRWKRRSVLSVWLLFVGIEAVTLLTNGIHHLYITEDSLVTARGLFDPTPGPLLWAHAAWKVGLVAVGMVLLVRQYSRSRGVIRLQSLAVIGSGSIALVTVFIELLDLVSVPGLDISTIGLALSGSLLLWALFYADFLELVPIARETLMENMDDGVVALDARDRVIDLNSKASRILDGDNTIIGQPARTAFARYPTLVEAYAADDTETTEITAQVGGQQRTYELRFSSVTRSANSPDAATTDDQSDAPIGRLVVFRDITDRKQREEELEAQNLRLERFASIVSHDLRNPLGIATRRLDLLREELEGESDHLPPIERAHERMATLIDDLLALARTGDVELESDSIAMADFVEACWASVRTDDATLEIEAPFTVQADRRLLQQFLENLIRNAVEHGGEEVTVTIGPLDDGRGFYFEDDGPGIPSENRDRVFEFGYSTSDSGTGFGLAIVREIAITHGWELTVTDSPVGGARFEINGVEMH